MNQKIIAPFKNKWAGYLLMAGIFLTALVYYHKYLYDFSCGDLGLKIAGAKLQTQHSNAYLYIASNGDTTVNGVVSTPVLNILHTVFINFTSCQVKQASFWGNFALVLCCLFFAAGLFVSTNKLRLFVFAAAALLFFLLSNPFFYNLMWGQEYLLFALVFFVLLYLLKKEQYFALGIVWALAIAVRPFLLACTILVLLYYNRKIIIGLVTGLALVLLLTLITNTARYWKEYSVAMKQYAHELPDMASGAGVYAGEHRASTNEAFGDCRGTESEEGMDRLKAKFAGGRFLQPLQFWLLKGHTVIKNTTFYSAIAALLSLFFAVAVRLRLKKIPPEKYAITMFVIYLFCEICTPSPRGEYSFVVWLFATACILATANIIEVILMILGLLLVNRVLYFKILGTGEILMLVACIMYIFRKSSRPYYMRAWPLKHLKVE